MIKIPRATYRLQLHSGFTFDDAAEVAGYLADLGISHLYASPYLQAAPGSTHGYDVVDTGRVNAELGGAEGHRRLLSALKENGLGQVLDIVPNHMAITGPENVWWWDVLENGPASPYASYFDVDWQPPEERQSNKILVPILGDHYGRALERGEIRLAHAQGSFCVRYFDHALPVSPHSLSAILERAGECSGSEHLAYLADAFKCLTHPSVTRRDAVQRRHRNKKIIQSQLISLLREHSGLSKSVDEAAEDLNASPDRLDTFLEEQNYRLAYWRTAARDLGYRRFFDINTLVGLRVEDEQVYADTHRLIIGWLREGSLDGVRIDHPDGLLDPEAYLRRLREAAPHAWIVVEKILHPGESLPAAWPVQGTTGYDFIAAADGLFIDPAREGFFSDLYRRFTGEETDYRRVVREKKHQVLHELFGSDINRLTDLVIRICKLHRRYRDYTRFEVNEALRELIACFPVYRSYLRADDTRVSEADRKIVAEAIESAKNNRKELDPELFDFLKAFLLLEQRGDLETELVLRFQQVTGPAAAKGVEDTAFYNYNRFISLNEVGGDPARFGLAAEKFHEKMEARASRQPHGMITTSTHDTKRSEDVRARLAVLSEIPGEWEEAVVRWSDRNARHWKGTRDLNFEYFLYQTLVGAWPITAERILAYAEKAAREAKAHTSWIRIDPDYEDHIKHFIGSILEDPEFCSDLEKFVAPLIHPGRINALSLTLVKLTAPGVPDMYRGTELWDLSLVDPDNRRPVDFGLRRRLLDEIRTLSPEEIMARMDEGAPKLWTIYTALKVRRSFPERFQSTGYSPLPVHGEKSGHVVAFSRGNKIATIIPRLVLTLKGDWKDTRVLIPAGRWRNVLSGDAFDGGEIRLQTLTARFPVALFSGE